jgi:hypothetical protein
LNTCVQEQSPSKAKEKTPPKRSREKADEDEDHEEHVKKTSRSAKVRPFTSFGTTDCVTV